MEWSYEKLVKADERVLEELMQKGTTPKVENLIGWEFRGYNLPYITEILGFRKFKKGFFVPEGESEKEVLGFNVLVVQNGFYGNWLALPSEAQPKRYGFYRVYPVRRDERDNKYPNALLLNYGIPRNGFHPARLLRDYLVQVEADNPDLYLGRAYFAIGSFRLFPSFFVLERYNRIQGEIGY